MPIDEQRKELEKLWNFPDSGFRLDRFIDENRHFFPDRKFDMESEHIIQVPQIQYTPPQTQYIAPQPAAEAPKEEEKKEERKDEKQEESTNKTEIKEDEDDYSWLDLAREKWSNFTSSIKDYAEDKKEDFRRKFSYYNETYYNQYHKDLPEDKYDEYLKMSDERSKGDKSIWQKTKGFFKDAGDKIANFTHIGEAKDKIANFTKKLFGKEDNETESEIENKESGDYHREEKKEDKENKDYREDRDYKREDLRDRDREEFRREDKYDRDEFRHEDKDSERKFKRDDRDIDREEFRRERQDFKLDDRERKYEDKDMKFLEDKERH